ncbi:DUF2169 family type VI secretion system accessory protein [Pseudoduganella sp. HUAS MS19]
MWAVKNRTPYEAAGGWGRDKNGVHEWIVVVKGTFDITADGRTVLAQEQIAPLLAPEHHGAPGSSSLRYEADLVAAKPTTDILLNGTACAPEGRPSTEFAIGMSVGPVRKVLRVTGERHWERGVLGVRPSVTSPVERLPIMYERAYGGYDRHDPDPAKHRLEARNPVGCGLASAGLRQPGQPLPNFSYPDGSVEQAGPAGFGALDCSWSPRRELAGTYDERWQQQRMPLLPEDWEPHSLQCAPADQRPPAPLRGGEAVNLVNLTPGGLLRFALPKIHLTFNTLIDGRTIEHRARVASVIIEPDYPRVIMVWQSVISCPGDIDYLEDTIVREKRVL